MQYCFQEEFRNEGKDTVDTTEFEKELEQAGQYWEEQDAPFLKN